MILIVNALLRFAVVHPVKMLFDWVMNDYTWHLIFASCQMQLHDMAAVTTAVAVAAAAAAVIH